MAKYGLTEQGPNPKRLDVILDEMHDDLTKYTGKNTRQNPQSFLNHYLTNVADAIAELWEFGTAIIIRSTHPAQPERVWTTLRSMAVQLVAKLQSPITAFSVRA